MYANQRMQQYQKQSIAGASPEQLTLKLYDLGISACHKEDRKKVRAVLVELLSSLNHHDEECAELAGRLQELYEYCLQDSSQGSFDSTLEILTELREAWRDGVMTKQAA